MKEFFGLEKQPDGEFDFLREAEGAWSWEHLTMVGVFIFAMIALAVVLGLTFRPAPMAHKKTEFWWFVPYSSMPLKSSKSLFYVSGVKMPFIGCMSFPYFCAVCS